MTGPARCACERPIGPSESFARRLREVRFLISSYVTASDVCSFLLISLVHVLEDRESAHAAGRCYRCDNPGRRPFTSLERRLCELLEDVPVRGWGRSQADNLRDTAALVQQLGDTLAAFPERSPTHQNLLEGLQRAAQELEKAARAEEARAAAAWAPLPLPSAG